MNVSEMSLFQRLKTSVKVRRRNLQTGALVDVVTADCMIIPSERKQLILPTGEVVEAPDYEGIFGVPQPLVRVGDIITHNGRDLFISSNPDAVDGVHKIELNAYQT